ncbi:hypothetical protein ES319_D03G047800v1 [Gossypium barbadense]|uniref:Uncharacterized protein n=2 Tax=Gossypium TaxID=3633 RepID=A0A5J5S182_GOSBA|nr:hypothetical protein ES319_D03G047800v1 [Gossypium barbadense]TYG75697.1 hypothetical protein ES288_D03G053000v1 [Gossypium darwinii]
MDAMPPSSSPLSLQPNGSSACASIIPYKHDSNPTLDNHIPSSKPLIRKKRRKTVDRDAPSSSSCSAYSSSVQKGMRLSSKRRNLRVRFGPVRRADVRDVDSIALPLGMSFAAVVAQVLEKIDVTNERLPPDYLSLICTSAVRESLANVFGDKFDCFARNFEKSFGSTLRTLRLINDSSKHKEKYPSNPNNVESSSDETRSRNSFDIKDSYSDVDRPSVSTQNQLNIHEEVQENIQTGSLNRELVIHGQVNQLACFNPRTGSVADQSVRSTIEKSVIEQVRSNDLKTLELSLTMRKLKLKEEQLALNFDSNHLERSKLAMGISKASFKAEKFKNELKDTGQAELLKKCIDCLVAGLLIMSFLLMYGAYVYSYKRITDATSSCNLSLEQVLVDPKAGVISQYRVPHSQVPGSSCKPNDVRGHADSCSSLFAYTTIWNFKSDDASHFFTVAVRNCLWFGWEVLCGYFRRKWILLGLLLGDSMLFAFPRKCLYVHVVHHSSWTC